MTNIMIQAQTQPRYSNIKGFTIIELLVSLLLGSVLLALSFNLYFSTKQSEMLATTILNTQTEARNALHFIRQGIEHAGFTTEVFNETQKETLFTHNTLFQSGQVIHIEESDNDNQTLYVRMQGDANKPLRDCTGDPIPPFTTPTQDIWYQFYVEKEQLLCQVYNDGKKVSQPAVLAAPIAALRLRAFTENISTPTTHIRATLKNTTSQEKTKGIQVQLVVRSAEKIRANNKMTIIPITGFDDLEFDDTHFYINTNRFFLAQNQ